METAALAVGTRVLSVYPPEAADPPVYYKAKVIKVDELEQNFEVLFTDPEYDGDL